MKFEDLNLEKHHIIVYVLGAVVAIGGVILLTSETTILKPTVKGKTAKTPSAPTGVSWAQSSGSGVGDPSQIDALTNMYSTNDALTSQLSDMSKDEVANYFLYATEKQAGTSISPALQAQINQQNDFYGITI